MIERMRDEPLNARDGHGTLPRDLHRKLDRGADDLRTGSVHDARDEPERIASLLRTKLTARERKFEKQRRVGCTSAARSSSECTDVRRKPYVDLLDAEPGIGRCPTYIDGTQRV
jgi:hypothetical protein